MAERITRKQLEMTIRHLNALYGLRDGAVGSFDYDVNYNNYYTLIVRLDGGAQSNVGGGLKIGDFNSALHMMMNAKRYMNR